MSVLVNRESSIVTTYMVYNSSTLYARARARSGEERSGNMPHIHAFVSEEELENLRQVAADNNFFVPSGPGKGGGSISKLLRTLGTGDFTYRLIPKEGETPHWHERWIGWRLAEGNWDTEQWPLWAQKLYSELWDLGAHMRFLEEKADAADRCHSLRLAFRRQRRRLLSQRRSRIIEEPR